MITAKCALCGEGLDREEPNAVYAPNPETLRMAWLHRDCGHTAYIELTDEERARFLKKDFPEFPSGVFRPF